MNEPTVSGRVWKMAGGKTEDGRTEGGGMDALMERLRPHLDDAVKQRIEHEIEYDLENPGRSKLIAKAEAVYNRLTNPTRKPAPGK